MLEINNYSNYILKDISFLCDNKDMIILGDNGAGKTTLAKVLSGLIFSQSVSLDDKKLSSISYEKRVEHINYIPPKLDIFDDYVDVEEYLSLNNLYDKKHIDKIHSELYLGKFLTKMILCNFKNQLLKVF